MFFARCGIRLWDRESATLPFCRLLESEGAGDEDCCSDFQSSERESSHGSMAFVVIGSDVSDGWVG